MRLAKRENPSMLSTRLTNDMWSWFDNMFAGSTGMALTPAMDVEETDKNLIVNAELPGIDPKNVEVFVRNGVLTIQGEKTQEAESREHDFIRTERRYGGFRREIALPATVDANKVEAKYHNGVLCVTIPKTGEPESKKIEVKQE